MFRHSLMFFCLLTLLCLCSQCSSNKGVGEDGLEMTIAFGSCAHQWDPQPIWREVVKNDPDLWVWLGDIIYADTEDMSQMKKDYDFQKTNVDYNYLHAACPVIGIWDDHDYGKNNAGSDYLKKDSSKLLLFDFLDVPEASPAREYSGAYQSYSYRFGDLFVKVILLDVRYFRDSISKKGGTILGQEQWDWLVRELSESTADAHVIGGGIQFLPEDHIFEKWANFPVERERLIQVIDQLDVANPILISGDRHLAEFSLIELPVTKKPLLEITSSGLTHHYNGFTEEANRWRVGPPMPVLNFGLLTIQKSKDKVTFMAEIRNQLNQVQYTVHSRQLADELKKRKS